MSGLRRRRPPRQERRRDDIPGEAPWGPGATGTATWTGVALADLSAETKPAERFGGSIPLDKACRPEVLLASTMNGEPLPLVHGTPLRVVVPGYIGARSVKGYFQHVVYRLLPEDGTAGPGAGMPLGLVRTRTGRRTRPRSIVMPIGIGFALVGVFCSGYAFWRYREVEDAVAARSLFPQASASSPALASARGWEFCWS